ncbi:MAG: methyltransferase domain-containing protein, partial [Endomicrobiales bacterium]
QEAVIELAGNRISLKRVGDTFVDLIDPTTSKTITDKTLARDMISAANEGVRQSIIKISALSDPNMVAGIILTLGRAVIEYGSKTGWWGENGLIWRIASNPDAQRLIEANGYDINNVATLPAFIQNAELDESAGVLMPRLSDNAAALHAISNLKRIADLEAFIRKTMDQRYVAWGMPPGLIDSVMDALLSAQVPSEETIRLVQAIILFSPFNKQMRDTYTSEKGSDNYKLAYAHIQPFLMGLPPGALVLDVGAGNNALGKTILTHQPTLHVTGTDIIDYHDQTPVPNLRFIKMDSQTHIPLPDQQADVIVCNAIAHHVAPEIMDSFLSEMSRLLKPGGKIILIENTFSPTLLANEHADQDINEEFGELVRQHGPEFANAYFAFNDWYTNIVIQEIEGIPLPYNFKSIEEWDQLLGDHGFISDTKNHFGFPRYSLHKPSIGIIVMKKPESPAPAAAKERPRSLSVVASLRTPLVRSLLAVSSLATKMIPMMRQHMYDALRNETYSGDIEIPLDTQFNKEHKTIKLTIKNPTAENVLSITALLKMVNDVDQAYTAKPFSSLMPDEKPIDGRLLETILENKDNAYSQQAVIIRKILTLQAKGFAVLISQMRQGHMQNYVGDKVFITGFDKLSVIIFGGGIFNGRLVRSIVTEQLRAALAATPGLKRKHFEFLFVEGSEKTSIIGASLLIPADNRRNMTAIGLDVGGTSVKGGGVDFDAQGNITGYNPIKPFNPDDQKGPAEYYAQIRAYVEDLRARLVAGGKNVSHFIGISHPGKQYIGKDGKGHITPASSPNIGRGKESVGGSTDLDNVDPASYFTDDQNTAVWYNDAVVQGLAGFHDAIENLRNVRGSFKTIRIWWAIRKFRNIQAWYLGVGTGLGTGQFKTDSKGAVTWMADTHPQHDPHFGGFLIQAGLAVRANSGTPATMSRTYTLGRALRLPDRATQLMLATWVPWEVLPQIVLSPLFGKMHTTKADGTKLTQDEQKTLRNFALWSMGASLVTGLVMGYLNGFGWGLVAWYSTAVVMHFVWNLLRRDLPATISSGNSSDEPLFQVSGREGSTILQETLERLGPRAMREILFGGKGYTFTRFEQPFFTTAPGLLGLFMGTKRAMQESEDAADAVNYHFEQGWPFVVMNNIHEDTPLYRTLASIRESASGERLQKFLDFMESIHPYLSRYEVPVLREQNLTADQTQEAFSAMNRGVEKAQETILSNIDPDELNLFDAEPREGGYTINEVVGKVSDIVQDGGVPSSSSELREYVRQLLIENLDQNSSTSVQLLSYFDDIGKRFGSNSM